jgi:hypothetical protein
VVAASLMATAPAAALGIAMAPAREPTAFAKAGRCTRKRKAFAPAKRRLSEEALAGDGDDARGVLQVICRN